MGLTKAAHLGGTKNIDVAAMAKRFVTEARAKTKDTQRAFATRCGVSVGVIHRIESRPREFSPSLETLARIAFGTGGKKFIISQGDEVVFQIETTKSRSNLFRQIFQQTQKLVVQTRSQTKLSRMEFGKSRCIHPSQVAELERNGAYRSDSPVGLETIVKVLGGDVHSITLGLGD